ncbi:hypothetical protein [Frigoribacterium sp. CFBP 13712]|uniref:hypothetical protein n=1 Tax=Frigoribacterium sp. CFBP 13712 TaxID=2775309 RepID=UPI00177C9171|nr:hypothetical protein [Frigoribacterium sp. CFBP 13712]MBD8704916.1 hypothetical protein [Frigoribacterium sp. CFBP 13712]
MLIELDAKLYIRVTAVSSIFSVTVVKHHAYDPKDRVLTADSNPDSAKRLNPHCMRTKSIAAQVTYRFRREI